MDNTEIFSCKNSCHDCLLFGMKVCFICSFWIFAGVYFTFYFIYILETYAISNNCNEMYIWWTLLSSSIYIFFQMCMFAFSCTENIDDLFLCALCSKNPLYKRKCIEDFDLKSRKLSWCLLILNLLYP